MIPDLTPYERGIVDHMKAVCSEVKVLPIRSFSALELRHGGEGWFAAIAVHEMANERNGVRLQNQMTADWFNVPAGTPWQECLPVEWPKD